VIELFETTLGDVYGYLARRCPDAATAEDLTAETFLAAASAAREPDRLDRIDVAWLIGTARHKLVDHWRRTGRQRRALEELWDGQVEVPDANDPVEALHVQDVLARLLPHHRAALTLRYLDGLPVEEVARLLERSLHATESLLVRAKAAYRQSAADLTSREREPS